MRVVSIRVLMRSILVLAVFMAALRYANEYSAGMVLIGTVLLIGIATLGAFYSTGPCRATRLGFAVFAGGYFALAFIGLDARFKLVIPTIWALNLVHDRVMHQLPFSVNFRAFTAIAQCLYTWLAGLLGAAIARRFEAGQAASLTTTDAA